MHNLFWSTIILFILFIWLFIIYTNTPPKIIKKPIKKEPTISPEKEQEIHQVANKFYTLAQTKSYLKTS